MGIEDVIIDKRVKYTPFKGCDKSLIEYGIIVDRIDKYIVVLYDGDIHPKLTDPYDLEYI